MSSLTQVCHVCQIQYILTKIKRSVGILSKIRYHVDINVLSNLYHALIYPFLIYGKIAWDNTIQQLSNLSLQKRAICLMTFTNFHEQSSPIFRKLNIIKLDDLISYHIAVFMYRFNNSLLPSAFDAFFSNYNTRSAAKQSYYPPKGRTNYGKFNIRFQGPKIWNSTDDKIKAVSLSQFKSKLKQHYLSMY